MIPTWQIIMKAKNNPEMKFSIKILKFKRANIQRKQSHKGNLNFLY